MKKVLHIFKKIYRRLEKQRFSLALTTLGTGGLLFYIISSDGELGRLTHLALPQILLLVVLVIIGHVMSAIKIQLSARLFAVDLSTFDAVMLVESGNLFNFLPFSAMSVRALYLKRVHGLKYVDFGMSTFALIIAALVSAGFWGLLGLLHIYLRGISNPSFFLLFAFLLYLLVPIVAFLIVWLFRKRFYSFATSFQALPDWFHMLLQSALSGVDIILAHPGVLFRFFVLSLTANLSVSVRFWLIGMWLGYPVDFASGLVLWNLNQVTSIFALLPSGAIGFREALTGLGATGLGVAAISGVLVSSVDRMVTLLLSIVLGSLSLLILRRRVTDIENRTTSITRTSEGRR